MGIRVIELKGVAWVELKETLPFRNQGVGQLDQAV